MFQRYMILLRLLASQRLFIRDGLAHIVSIPNGFAQQLLSVMASAYAVAIPDGSTHWLLSAMAFIAHTVFMGLPFDLSAMACVLDKLLWESGDYSG